MKVDHSVDRGYALSSIYYEKKGSDALMNRIAKALIPFVLIVALLIAAMPVFAAESPTTMAIDSVTVKNATYNGKQQTPKVAVYDANGNKIKSRYYAVKVKGSPVDAGRYLVTVTAKAPYTGKKSAWFKIGKAENPFRISVGQKYFKRNTTMDQTTSIRVSGVKENAKLSSWKSLNTKLATVRGGTVTIKRGKYGTAAITITTRATKNYKATKKTICIKVTK